MTETQRNILRLVQKYGPQSHYGIYHVARAEGFKFSPSGVRTRVSELVRAGFMEASGSTELTPSGRHAKVWKIRKLPRSKNLSLAS